MKTIIVHIEGGVVQSVSSDDPAALKDVRVVLLDYDVQGAQDGTYPIRQSGGTISQAFVTGWSIVSVDTAVAESIEAVEAGGLPPGN